MELCQHVLDRNGIPNELVTHMLRPIFIGIGGLRNYNVCWREKLLQHAMKIIKKC